MIDTLTQTAEFLVAILARFWGTRCVDDLNLPIFSLQHLLLTDFFIWLVVFALLTEIAK